LHVGHLYSSLKRAAPKILAANRMHSIRPRGSRKGCRAPVIELRTHASGDSSPY